MDKLKKITNDFSGLLSFVSFLGLILFWIFGMQAGLDGLTQDHVSSRLAQKEYQEKTIGVLSEIRDSLKDSGRDHKEFKDQLKTNTIAVNKVSEAVVNISYSLKSIERCIERTTKK